MRTINTIVPGSRFEYHVAEFGILLAKKHLDDPTTIVQQTAISTVDRTRLGRPEDIGLPLAFIILVLFR